MIIEIGLTSTCNLNCPLCSRNKKLFKDNHQTDNKFRKDIHIDMDLLMKWLLKVTQDQTEEVTIKLIGAVGEPTMHPRFLELIELIQIKQFTLWLSTNGSVNSTKWWKKLGLLLPQKSTINVDIDHTDEKHQSFYRRGSNLTKIIKNVESLHKSRPKSTVLQIQRIDFIWNRVNLINMRKLIKDEWNFFDNIYTIPSYWWDQSEFTENLSPWKSKYDILNKRIKSISSLRATGTIDCEAQKDNTIYVNYVGDVIPCCYINDYVLKNNIENIPNIKDEINIIQPYFKTIYTNNNPLCSVCDKTCSTSAKRMYKQFNLDP